MTQANTPRAICTFFVDRHDKEYVIEVYSVDEGSPEDFGVYLLLDDGTKGESVDGDAFYDEVHEKYQEFSDSRFD